RGGQSGLDWGNQIFIIGDLQAKYNQLSSQYNEVLSKSQMYESLIRENEILRAQLDFKRRNYRMRMLPAEVIGRSPSQWFDSVIIDRGSVDGIRPDMVVVSPDGLVGRIFDVGRASSKVMMITDPNSSVSSVARSSRDVGVIVGAGANMLKMKYVASSAVIKEGDPVITSGASEVFPQGLKIGVITKVFKREYDLFQDVEITPAVDFSRLEDVFIIY
ncbi:MAG: rod shape-determining protein MreC, partial [bacterium]